MISEWLVAVLGLCLVAGGGIFTFAHRQGKTDQKVEKHNEDIDHLWDSHREQNVSIQKIEKAIPEINTNIKWIKNTLTEMKQGK